ncbi:hypothetical protein EST38_g4956 [Candolleomyces aberdarensis]|uniref:Uncharacterized protein n=1 Tax=Candolleomyces aberdarensis TaxID=2316362 RepID=A0A4Q2DLP4_9AGAR|nr:hypothetical protein EST38_g4956 [Candolleomyces aberdarensis]
MLSTSDCKTLLFQTIEPNDLHTCLLELVRTFADHEIWWFADPNNTTPYFCIDKSVGTRAKP